MPEEIINTLIPALILGILGSVASAPFLTYLRGKPRQRLVGSLGIGFLIFLLFYFLAPDDWLWQNLIPSSVPTSYVLLAGIIGSLLMYAVLVYVGDTQQNEYKSLESHYSKLNEKYQAEKKTKEAQEKAVTSLQGSIKEHINKVAQLIGDTPQDIRQLQSTTTLQEIASALEERRKTHIERIKELLGNSPKDIQQLQLTHTLQEITLFLEERDKYHIERVARLIGRNNNEKVEKLKRELTLQKTAWLLEKRDGISELLQFLIDSLNFMLENSYLDLQGNKNISTIISEIETNKEKMLDRVTNKFLPSITDNILRAVILKPSSQGEGFERIGSGYFSLGNYFVDYDNRIKQLKLDKNDNCAGRTYKTGEISSMSRKKPNDDWEGNATYKDVGLEEDNFRSMAVFPLEREDPSTDNPTPIPIEQTIGVLVIDSSNENTFDADDDTETKDPIDIFADTARFIGKILRAFDINTQYIKDVEQLQSTIQELESTIQELQ